MALSLGDTITSRHRYECPICRLAVCRGDTIRAAAYDALADGLVWPHLACADFWLDVSDLHEAIGLHATIARNTGVGKLLTNGWFEVRDPQSCFRCHEKTQPGVEMHRMVNLRRRCYDLVCCRCHHGDWRQGR